MRHEASGFRVRGSGFGFTLRADEDGIFLFNRYANGVRAPAAGARGLSAHAVGVAVKRDSGNRERFKTPMLSDRLVMQIRHEFVGVYSLFSEMCPELHISARARRAPQVSSPQ